MSRRACGTGRDLVTHLLFFELLFRQGPLARALGAGHEQVRARVPVLRVSVRPQGSLIKSWRVESAGRRGDDVNHNEVNEGLRRLHPPRRQLQILMARWMCPR